MLFRGNAPRLFFSVAVILVLLAGLFLPAVSNAGADDNDNGHPSGISGKGHPKLDTALNDLVFSCESCESPDIGSPAVFSLVEPQPAVRVIVESLSGHSAGIEAIVSGYGLVEGSHGGMVQAVVPVSGLKSLAENPQVRLVRQPLPPMPFVITTSEGVSLVNADGWHVKGYDGTGVKVGILDVGFYGYAALLGTELPAAVTVNWSASLGGPGSNEHGTACAEIVYDMAPGATFYLANFQTSVEMADAVDWFIAQGVDVISCSVGFPAFGTGEGTGPVCDIIDTARAARILWSQSAGNSARMHWQGDWTDTDSDNWNEFSSTDEGNYVYAAGGSSIVAAIRWDDGWGTSSNDYDLYLCNQSGTTVASSEYLQDGNDYAYEALVYDVTTAGNYYLKINRYNAGDTSHFHLYSYYHELHYQTASGSLCIPADSSSAMTVGAVYYFTPDILEPFSSRGPTDNGTVKPDIVAPDGVGTVSYGGSGFYGTSASAPHGAGAAVLVKQRFPSYSPNQVQSYLESKAVDLGTAGKDNLYGSGRLDLPILQTLTISTNGNGNVIPVAGNHTYEDGTVVSINGTPGTNWAFVNWTGDTAAVVDANSSGTTITMDDDYSISANFERTHGTLTITGTGNGAVTPASGNHTYTVGFTENITATPDSGWRFSGWTGDVDTVTDVNSANTTITMDGDYAVTAVFDQPVLNMSVNGSGTVTPVNGSHTYPVGESVSINATPAANWAFVNWTGDVADPNSSNTTIIMDTDKTVVANFNHTHSTLLLSVSGNGTITPVSGNHTYPLGYSENITATPDTGWRFTGWTGDVDTIADADSTNTTVVMNDDYTITAVFDRPVLNLSVSGSGTVTPPSGSYDCDLGSSVNVSATPSSGWQFSSWTGDTSTIGNANCSSTNITMNDDYTITAVFTEIPAPVVPPFGGGFNSGGGGGATDDKRFTNVSGSASTDGTLWEDVVALSVDIRAEVSIPEGTMVLNRNGYPLFSITVATVADPQDANPGTQRVGEVYDFIPDGVTFSLPALLTLYYDEDILPDGVDETNLYIALWNEETGLWERLECDVDTEADTVSARITHFSRYTIQAGIQPADFSASGLIVSPQEIFQGDTVTVSATVANSGDLAGSETVSLQLDGETIRTRSISLYGGESRNISFNFSAGEPGIYTVSLMNVQRNFTVLEQPLPPAALPEDFVIASLSVTPAEADPGQEVSVSCTVTNTGEVAGRTDIALNLNGTIVETKQVMLGAGDSTIISFIVAPDVTGKNLIQVQGQSVSFILRGESTQPEPAPLPHDIVPSESDTTIITPLNAAGDNDGFNWKLFWIVCGTIIIAAGAIAVFVTRQHRVEKYADNDSSQK